MAELQLGGKTIATQTGNEEAIMHSSVLRLTPRSQPSNPVQGDMYLDSSDNTLKIYSGSFFKNIVTLSDLTVDVLIVAGGGGGGANTNYDQGAGGGGILSSIIFRSGPSGN